MKSTHFFRYLKFALFLAVLSSFSFAYAYDFQSNGIYYNITSTNTVEVTYKDNNYGSYSGEVIIPSTVTRNNKTYTVTAIGDSAFCYSDVDAVTIPETTLSIGCDAFSHLVGLGDYEYGKYMISITCLSTTPPDLNGVFGDNNLFGGYPSSPYYNCNWIGLLVLFVPDQVREAYKSSDWASYFDYICYIGAGSTTPPQITIVENGFDGTNWCRSVSVTIDGEGDIYMLKYMFAGLNYLDEGNWRYSDWDFIGCICSYSFNWGEGAYASEFGEYGNTNYMLRVYAFAHEDGKLPSDISFGAHDHPIAGSGSGPGSNLDPELMSSWVEDIYFHDFMVDGVCYRYLGDNEVAVAHDSEAYITWQSWDVYNYGEIISIDTETSVYDATSNRYNDKTVVIPKSINYNGNTYNIASIDNYTFSSYEEIDYNYQYWYYYYDGYEVGSSVWPIVVGGGVPACLILPSSLRFIDDNAFNHNVDTYESSMFIITGDGAWSAGALNVAIQRLDIASGISAIPGLKVNPREVYCYAKVPPTCDENTFTDYSGTLHVPESSLAAYFTAPYWCNFANIVGDAVELTDLTLNKDSAELLVGQQLTLNATIQPTNANIDSIEWSSSNEEIVTVVNGVVTANALGECDIIATCLDKRAICHVKVVEQIATITLDQHRASLLPNHILTLTPTVTPVATDLVVTSSNPAVAAARLTGGKVQVVGVSVGTAIIKVASVDNNAVADSCIVNVYTDAGDVDGDGFVKIDDVTTLIDYLLGSDPSIDMGNADIDYDGNVNIADVTVLIDILLNGNTSIPSRETFTVNGVSFTMIRVPAGTFMMGATEEQGSDAYDWEKPVHEVTLPSPYLIGETEVTQELWLAVMGTNPSKHVGSLQKPVENVTWLDCQEFITRLNQLTGLSFRLPTEAEWEYAARGANRSRGYKYAGSDNISEVGNISSSTTLPVGSLQPNELYLYDMSGNVDEWVQDYWGNYTSGPQTNPTGPSSGTDHVYRSGSWYSGADVARVSYRFHRSNTFQRGTLGLRLAL